MTESREPPLRDCSQAYASVKVLARVVASAVGNGAAVLKEDVAFQGFLESEAGSVEAGLNPPAVGGRRDLSHLGGEEQRAGIVETAIQFQPQQTVERQRSVSWPAQAVYGEDQQRIYETGDGDRPVRA